MLRRLKRTWHGGSRNFGCVAAVLFALVVAQRAQALPPNAYAAHVFFDNGTAAPMYFHSSASCVAPSAVEVLRDKLPIESGQFHSAPNSLRLTWTSARGGDWHASLKSTAEYVRPSPLSGDTLSLWCYSVEGLKPEEAPRIYFQDTRGKSTPTIWLLEGREALPAGKWVEIRLPPTSFGGIYQDTGEDRFDARRLQSITLLQNLEDGREHTLFFDDVSLIDGRAAPGTPLPAPTGLKAEGFDRHIDRAWQPVEHRELI